MTFFGTLHPYQEADVELMVEQMKVLLCYEMGLGKTVMGIAAVERLHEDGQVDAGLVIAQSDLLYQWQDKIHKFTCSACLGKLDDGEEEGDGTTHRHVPTATTLVIDGTPQQRERQYAVAAAGGVRYTMLNYEKVVNDWQQVRRLPRDFLIGDEITAIKGFRAQRSKRVKRLQAPYVYGMTGDPMENGKLEELFSIMQWVDERVLGRFDLFDRTFVVRNGYGSVSRYRNVKTFRQRMHGHWARRTQDEPEVAPYLPKVMPPDNVKPALDGPARTLYGRIAKALLADLAEAAATGMGGNFNLAANYGFGDASADVIALRGKIMSKTQTLLMLCDHPELLRHSAALYRSSQGDRGSAYCHELEQAGLFDKVKATPKADACKALVERCLTDPRSKVVLFSHDVPTLDYLERELGGPGTCAQYHGGMSAKQKEASKRRFQTQGEVRVLLSSDAGGYGVDLPQGNHIVNYDQPWSSGAAKQRNSRIIRASSTFGRVHIHNLLVKDSVDEWAYAKVGGKQAVSGAFLDGRGLDKKGGLALDINSLSAWLREHAP